MNGKQGSSTNSPSTERASCFLCGTSVVHEHCGKCSEVILCGACPHCDPEMYRTAEIEQRKIVCKSCGVRFDPGPTRNEHSSSLTTFKHREGVCSKACLFAVRRARLPEELAKNGVPERYRRCSFDNFDVYARKLTSKVDMLRGIAGSRPDRGVFLFGPVGGGKTHLAVSLAAEWLIRGYEGCFLRAIEFILRCQRAFRNDETPDQIVGDLLDGRFLVLDDLGSGKETEFARQCILHLIDEAYCREKVLVVTSNLGLNELNDLDPRIPSRLAEMCDIFHLDADDYRVRCAVKRQKVMETSTGRVM